MKITLTDAGKRFNRNWIFRHVSYQFTNGHTYAITGPNGSGKSTLLQVIAGSIASSEGVVNYELAGGRWPMAENTDQSMGDNKIDFENTLSLEIKNRPATNDQLPTSKNQLSTDQIYQYISIVAPFLEVVEEMTLIEFLEFHKNFKPFLSSVDTKKIISLVGLEKSAHKQIRYYSSGMKQRVKLAQAFFSDTTILLLDEPCTNLDSEGIALYQQLIKDHCKNRLVIISSNDVQEYEFCEKKIDILEYK
jgi:ABC-type multidrug transport system ATPase subunit